MVTNTRVCIKLDKLKLNKTPHKFYDLNFNDPSIGTLDIETYMHDGIAKVYALGFYTKTDN